MMSGILMTLLIMIAGCYALRWGHMAIVKRQRIDWVEERELFRQHLKLLLRVMRKLIRLYG